MSHAKVLRAAASAIRNKLFTFTCTAIAGVEQGDPGMYTDPGPVGLFWRECHKPEGYGAWDKWFSEGTDRAALLEEMALCLEKQGYA